MKVKLSLVLTLCFSVLHAKDLGVHGNVYPIVEDDLLQTMKVRAAQLEQQGQLKEINEMLLNDVTGTLKNIHTTYKLTKTKKERTYYIDLTDALPELKRSMSALSSTRISTTLIFIDGTDKAQLRWALAQVEPNKKIVLLKGDALALMQAHGVKFYLDQQHALTSKLKITQIPAKAIGDNHWFKVHEVKL